MTEQKTEPFPLKIRTITTGIYMNVVDIEKIKEAVEFNLFARSLFEKEGFDVQTTRITTNSFEEYLDCSNVQSLLKTLEPIDSYLNANNLSFFNIGPAKKVETIRMIPEIIKSTSRISASAQVQQGDQKTALAAAEACLQISKETPGGEGSFNYTVSFNCQPGIPFFPAGYHGSGETSFAIGCEPPEVIVNAIKSANGDFVKAEENIKTEMEKWATKIQNISEKIVSEYKKKIIYDGIDSSFAPSPRCVSIMEGFKSLGISKFGGPGSLHVCSLITRALKSLNVKLCGYSGLMLPPLEDTGLAEQSHEYSITDLLVSSSVCGIGIDTVPIPGTSSSIDISLLYLDVAALAFRLNKPLSARLFPCTDKTAGLLTNFQNEHLCNGHVFPL
eukprot:c18610_g1_i1.p1 GENE.c18610_g1_i1~~c18610_g1_i1.p1  ORF type:complete len:388 (+),score=152.02 c18610_g1_i1:42-1205(+)